MGHDMPVPVAPRRFRCIRSIPQASVDGSFPREDLMMRRAGAVFLCLLCVGAAPKLAITEIMIDPTSPETEDQQTEWVEIQNYGDVPVKLAGYMLTSGTAAEPHALRQKYVFRDV